MRVATVYVTKVRNKAHESEIELRWTDYKVAIDFMNSIFEDAINSDEILIEFYSEQVDTGESRYTEEAGDDDW